MKAKLIPATLGDYPVIQNMARFYVYEMSRECGLHSADWACPADGLYESFDFKHYFVDSDRRAYLVKVDEELAGFVLLYQTGEQLNTQWHIGEFFIQARFQHRGIGRRVAQQVWQQHPGSWEITVIPENQRALQFWRKTVAAVMQDNFIEELKLKTGRVDPDQPNRIFLTFDTTITTASQDKPTIRPAMTGDIQLENNIILLMGIAGTGKKTIGEEISKQDASFKLVHHHAWIDPILKLLSNNEAAAWQSLDEKGWGALNQARDVIFHTIANVCPKESNFIITYEMLANNLYHQEFFDTLNSTVKKRNATLIPVRLICELDELLQRVEQPNRSAFYKTRDQALIKNRFINETVFFSNRPNELTLDVTHLSPSISARQIIQFAESTTRISAPDCPRFI